MPGKVGVFFSPNKINEKIIHSTTLRSLIEMVALIVELVHLWKCKKAGQQLLVPLHVDHDHQGGRRRQRRHGQRRRHGLQRQHRRGCTGAARLRSLYYYCYYYCESQEADSSDQQTLKWCYTLFFVRSTQYFAN